MREVEIGCKVPENGGMEGFGDQEVADLLNNGWRVVSIKSKGALMRQMPSTGGEKKWGFIGFAMIVQFEEPNAG
jgi:hypothetical protein